MNHREYAMKHPSFTMSERDIAALDMLAEALYLRNRSEVVRYLIRQAAQNIHKPRHKREAAHA